MKKFLDLFFRDMTSLGGMFFYGLVVGGFFFLGDYDMVKRLLWVFIIITAISVIIRSVYFKDRPKKQKHSSFLERLDASSFPSIHAARSVSLAIILGRASEAHLFFIFAIIVAAIICFSRHYLNKHDSIDIVAGIILGILAGCLL